MTPVISEISKSFTSVLALPTISGSFGQEGDIQQWRDIDEAKRRYLLQVMPPSDIIPEVIRSIIARMNMTNAGILFDNSFGKCHCVECAKLIAVPRHTFIVYIESMNFTCYV